MIVFGHNSFLLHSCKPSQLGMSDEFDKQYIIERRQRYFHLFWIPFFGIGKIWAMRNRQDNKLYVPSDMLLKALNALPLKEKTPWYTYSLLVIALAAFIITPIYLNVQAYFSHKRDAAYAAELAAQYTAAITSPTGYEYFELQNEHYKQSYLKLIGYDETSLKFVRQRDGRANYSSNGMLEVFATPSADLDTITLAKSELLKCVNKQDNGYAIFSDDNHYKVTKLKVYDYPYFKVSASGYENGKYSATLQNIGANASYVKFIPEKTNVTLDAIQPTVNEGSFITLDGKYDGIEPSLKGKLVFRNDANVELIYDLSIYSSHLAISLIEK